MACYFPFVLFPTIAAVWNAPDALRLHPLPVRNALRVCVLALLTVITAQNGTYLWLAILQKLGLNVFAVGTPVPTTRSELYLCLASAAILAPICEELLFRGAMLSAWEARGGRRAVWITTILFAMLHGSTEGLPAVSYTHLAARASATSSFRTFARWTRSFMWCAASRMKT